MPIYIKGEESENRKEKPERQAFTLKIKRTKGLFLDPEAKNNRRL